eukprot:CAMPEP_0115582536 /NCGR_PEP_ID=MMETSP0272-20121206/5711_1 /TAXON_ID=71861 /ORGANISM="Scrippsiella trochoidea, Strain CCMP3099" /LENGTH=290 /DNA_ID=CAMNT_0003017527 /DNA_START=189 /DNA_END=1061 /DNA_ORIENTATION=+
MTFKGESGFDSTCCLVLPLKFGVGLISMLVFSQSLLCIIALFTGDIRFQENGYNVNTYRLPSIIGAAGLLFGFVGLLGVFDEKLLWVKAFNRFLMAKIALMIVAAIADYWTLGKCDSWLESPEHLKFHQYGQHGVAASNSNAALDSLADLHVCPWARWAYLIGFGVDVSVWVYCAFKSILYEMHLHTSLGYPIDFGNDRSDAEGRWRFYQVKDPRADALRLSRLPEVPEKQDRKMIQYGALETAVQQPYDGLQGYGPDGMHPINRGMSASGIGFNPIVGSPATVYSPVTA